MQAKVLLVAHLARGNQLLSTAFFLNVWQPMSRRKQWSFVILISTVQLALMLIVVLWMFSQYGDTADRVIRRQIANSNHAFASQLVHQIRSMNLSDFRENPKEQAKLQTLVEETRIPNRGFIALLDAKTGRYLFHPEIQTAPPLTGEFWHSESKPNLNLSDNQDLSTALHDPSVSFVINTESGSQIVNGCYLPEMEAILLVCQRSSFAMAMNAILTQPLTQISFALTLTIGLMGTSLSLVILRRFESHVDNKQRELERRVAFRSVELIKTKRAVIFGLARLAESRDNDTGEHLDRIRKYVAILAKHLAKTNPDIDEEFISNLELASSLHDIGKVGIPDAILLKPGELDPTERRIMELHTTIGGECLEAIGNRLGETDFLQMACQVAYWHHERWDGTGYPHKLAGQRIPMVARIVAVADVYDALTSRRPYKQPIAHNKSRIIITAGSGSQFDPEVVDAFLAHEDEFEKISLQQQHLNDEQLTCNIMKHTNQLCELSRVEN